MRKVIPLAVVLLALLFLGSCSYKGTLLIYNELTAPELITDLYVYPLGSPDTYNEISSPLEHGDMVTVYAIDPGDTVVEAKTDQDNTAWKIVLVEDGHVHDVYIYNSDIDN